MERHTDPEEEKMKTYRVSWVRDGIESFEIITAGGPLAAEGMVVLAHDLEVFDPTVRVQVAEWVNCPR